MFQSCHSVRSFQRSWWHWRLYGTLADSAQSTLVNCAHETWRCSNARKLCPYEITWSWRVTAASNGELTILGHFAWALTIRARTVVSDLFSVLLSEFYLTLCRVGHVGCPDPDLLCSNVFVSYVLVQLSDYFLLRVFFFSSLCVTLLIQGFFPCARFVVSVMLWHIFASLSVLGACCNCCYEYHWQLFSFMCSRGCLLSRVPRTNFGSS